VQAQNALDAARDAADAQQKAASHLKRSADIDEARERRIAEEREAAEVLRILQADDEIQVTWHRRQDLSDTPIASGEVLPPKNLRPPAGRSPRRLAITWRHARGWRSRPLH
jgi:hypothetical protein